MILALVFCYLSVFVAANPFHKYPFVFLLDVGNEELQRANSEQIRVSVPGGSIALRYPGAGEGNVISHVRVSGIDFGTDLKVNIVDGGPGTKYVVLVFMGKPGVPYDAVVTLETITDDNVDMQSNDGIIKSDSSTGQDQEDENNSAEDLSETDVTNVDQSETNVQESNEELMQPSSRVYSYADNERVDEDDDINVETGEESNYSYQKNEVSDDAINSNEQPDEETLDRYQDDVSENEDVEQEANPNVEVKGIDDEDDEDEEDISSNQEQYSPNKYVGQAVILGSNSYSKYIELQNHLKYNNDVYSQQDLQKNFGPVYQNEPLDYEGVDAAAPTLYDEDEEDSGLEYRYRDFNNNNYIDADENYAVA